MKATAQISSNNGHMVLPAAIRRFLGIGHGDKIEFESRDNGEVVIRPLPALDSLFGSLPGKGKPQADESKHGWHARAERVVRKGME
ncbi:MAG TPA: AbrB/MazE/SpoVT family DNA-binding domain-containing protein [Verrucomicrobiae bacterium]|jgi:AbrB family looped-hinge helix DNA binding protein|nr:AbrB/MazE/SpoVT family DNA-binding domain-containing protein [Verrucomicrobiae bacterium]